MDFEIIWTVPAADDLEAAERYVARQSPDADESLRLELLDSVEVLAGSLALHRPRLRA